MKPAPFHPSLFDAGAEVGAPVIDLAERGQRPTVPAPVVEPSAPAEPEDLPVRIVRSPRRHRTVTARMRDGVLEVRMPDWMTKADTDRYVADMVAKFLKRRNAERVDLPDRAALLARRYRLPLPASIRWVDNMAQRWGSCTMADRTIRISSALATYPGWVLDAVVVHELAHLVHGDHSPAFWELANRYPRMERARGYLIARSTTDEEHD